jgi:hypothetical protein
MIIGIVGSEAKKFTPETEYAARQLIHTLLIKDDVWGMASGHCHLGGIDIWAEEETMHLQGIGKPIRDDNYFGYKPDLELYIYPPAKLAWDGGYKQRNIQIAKRCDELHNITVRKLPPGFDGMVFSKGCYHCDTLDHVKSGGCYTMKYARKLGKPGILHVI